MPLIYILRVSVGLAYWTIPFFIAFAVMGQLVGGRLLVSKKADKLKLSFLSKLSMDESVICETDLTVKE